jgi:hypothetical protein
MVRTSALFGAGALFIGNEALMNDRVLVINGLIHLSTTPHYAHRGRDLRTEVQFLVDTNRRQTC